MSGTTKLAQWSFRPCSANCRPSDINFTMDIETHGESNETFSPEKPHRRSFLHKWGPALLAIAGVLAVNAFLLGPTGQNIPALTPQQLNARKLGEERTKAVLQMESDAAADRRMGRSFGSRNLSESEGGIMEYTRRRHRILGDYVHEDVSGEFTLFGKWSVSIIYFAFWVFLMFHMFLWFSCFFVLFSLGFLDCSCCSCSFFGKSIESLFRN